ncbi:MAG: sugar transporter [Flavobacterium sp.]|uniref:polysaccharide biosynthesis/export family protein n=1 Tax=unclassified Flavobacterium TaxID=196869 RepID=UPI000C3C488A|nr:MULTISPECIES: polysaccharide biosynthesis/export family protein [unclassified Flavobacterium]MBF02165.1 sugar transporter [Flavobacterium sp.]MCO6164215.1 polysaccharide biosynthesis/export family protein [Flavobacterium sp. NRK F7]|tara:strand:- start:713 stop:1474 length:762 start_codon:yes stop_codon:yes gene_type:complete
MKKIKIFYFTITFFCLVSCASKKDLIYLQNNKENQKASSYEPYLQKDDVLLILVTSENPEIAAPYNLKSVIIDNNTPDATTNTKLQTYIIDSNGNIEFPILGSIHLAGLTKSDAVAKVKEALKDHVTDAVVNIRILNFKISVLGEVTHPGSYTIKSERITLLEALSLAGDLTIYGKRNNILLIREQNGNKVMERIDITKTDFMDSPYYYLSQNDVLYVEPNKTRINSSSIGPNITVGISALSLIVTIIALTTR